MVLFIRYANIHDICIQHKYILTNLFMRSQKWKTLASTLGAQIEQLRQENTTLQQLEQQRNDHSAEGRPQDCTKGSLAEMMDYRAAEGNPPEPCRLETGSLCSKRAPEEGAQGLPREIRPASGEHHAAQLGDLAAECERTMDAGMTEEACRFLMEVRSMQLAAQSVRQAPSAAVTQASEVPCIPIISSPAGQRDCSKESLDYIDTG